MLEILQTVFMGIMAVGTCVGAFKLYFVLKEYPPHMHTERHPGENLTVDGIVFPRGTEKRSTF